MPRLDRDVVAAVFLVSLSCVFYAASFAIRTTSYGTVGSEVWPRAILIALGALCVLYLINSIRDRHQGEAAGRGGGLAGWFATYRNAILCFGMYGLFLITLPYLGMLLAGIAFVFLLLNMLGGWELRKMAVHGAIAVTSIGVMWAIFTFGLQVILPEGEVLRIW